MHLSGDCTMGPTLYVSPAKRPFCYLAHQRGPLGWEPRKRLVIRTWNAVWISTCHISHPTKSSSQATITCLTGSPSAEHEEQAWSSFTNEYYFLYTKETMDTNNNEKNLPYFQCSLYIIKVVSLAEREAVTEPTIVLSYLSVAFRKLMHPDILSCSQNPPFHLSACTVCIKK